MAKNKQIAGETSGGSPRLPPSTIPENDAPLRRRSDPFLIICRCFSLITAISAILCIAVNVLSAVRSFKNGSDVFDGIFRCYAVAIAVFTVVAETEWSVIFNFWKVLEYWPGRGMLQILAFPDYSGQRQDLVLLQNIASYLLLSCGVVYLIAGILCIGFLKRKLEHKETTRVQAVKDLEELERRKNELEALLIQNNV
ncbi:hypothetical protein KSS87_011971 [Heliosperma pusillum]|nr:hypothetical protein KSS87_011971 [Heliosperma pusillum]